MEHPLLQMAHGHVRVGSRIMGVQLEDFASFLNRSIILPNAGRSDGRGIMGRNGKRVQVRGTLCLRHGLREAPHSS